MRKPRSRLFLDLSRRQRRDLFVAKRWRIAQDPDGLGVFTSHVVLPGTPRWGATSAVDNWNAPCSFLSRKHAKEGWVYSCEMKCPILHVIAQLDEMVTSQMVDLLASDGMTFSDAVPELKFSRIGGHGKHALYELEETTYPRLAVFGGKTLFGAEAELLSNIARNQWPDVFLGAYRQPFGRRGIGIEMVVDEEYLDVKKIAHHINAFLDGGESVSPGNPVDMDKLAPEIERYISGEVRRNMYVDLKQRKMAIPDYLEK